MKKIALIALLLASVVACNRIKEEKRVLVKGENDAVLVVNTPKARCYKCQSIIEGGLNKMEGVSQSILNLNTKEVSIVYSPEKISPERLNTTVDDLVTQIPCK